MNKLYLVSTIKNKTNEIKPRSELIYKKSYLRNLKEKHYFYW